MADDLLRNCDCPHGFPLCACCEGLLGKALHDRSRWLSALAGWPARVEPASAAAILAAYGRPIQDADRPAASPWPVRDQQMPPSGGGAERDCGCGRGLSP
jgi:hypothetical protein